jgi:outer membrane protein assembly factor BamB
MARRPGRWVPAGLAAAVMVCCLHGPAAASAAPKPVVLVPYGAAGDGCPAELTLAGELSLAAGLELVRTAVDEREALDEARRRAGADLAVAGRRVKHEGARPGWIVALAREGHTPVEREGHDPGEVLRALWPVDLPPLPRRAVPAAAQPAALEAACARDAPRAFALSGAAVGPALWGALVPPAGPKGEDLLGLDLARALGAARAGRHAETLTRTRQVASRLAAGEAWPLWRSAEGAGPAAVVVAGESALVLRAGALEVLELATGTPLGRAVVGRLAPPLASLGHGLVLAAGPGAVTALSVDDGAVVWSIELASPWPEVVVDGERVFVAGTRELLALDVPSGRVLWRLDMPVEPSAGPVRAGRRLVLPAETELVVVDAERGVLLARADVGDELVGPLAVRGTEVWCAIGADQVGRLDVARLSPSDGARESARLDRRARGAFGRSWPPALTDTAAVVTATDPKRGPALLRISGAGDGAPEVLLRGQGGRVWPLGAERVLVVDKRGDTVVALDAVRGQPLWRLAVGGPVRAVEVALGSVWIAAGRQLWSVDAATGRVDRRVEVGEPVAAVAVATLGAVVLGEGGTAWGVPSVEDPRALPLLRELRTAEARAALALGRAAEARVALEAAGALDPEDVEARVSLARLAEQTSAGGGGGGPRAWLRVLAAARPGEPATAEAHSRLAALTGLVARVPVGGAPHTLVAVGPRAFVGVGREVLALGTDGRILWRRPGAALVLAEGVLRVDGQAVRPTDGQADAAATTTSTAVAPSLSLSATGGLVVTDAVRRTSARPLELGLAGPVAASDAYAWVAQDATVLVLRLGPR